MSSLRSESLIAALSYVPRDEWDTAEVEDGHVYWLPLLQISASDLWLGLDEDGDWTLGRIGGRVTTSAASNPPQPWMTMLDMSEEDFRDRLRSAADRFQLPNDVLQDAVPVDDVIVMAIQSRSKHWAERAIIWMHAHSLREKDVWLIRELVGARWATQRTRHGARRILKAHGLYGSGSDRN